MNTKNSECIQKDDIQSIMPKMREADIVVYATPVYCYGMSGQLKNLIDRMVSIASPFIEAVDGRTRHLPADGEKGHKTVLVANCGLWGMENFTPLLAHVQVMAGDPPSEYAGALLRPHGEALRGMLKSGDIANDVIEAAREDVAQRAVEVVLRHGLPDHAQPPVHNRADVGRDFD